MKGQGRRECTDWGHGLHVFGDMGYTFFIRNTGSGGTNIMGWKECDSVSERLEFVKLASQEGSNKSELCRRFGVSRKTGDKWLARWRADGEAGLEDRSRRPIRSPCRTPASVERAVLELRKKHPYWGGRKLHRLMKELGHEEIPCASTITAILKRHGLIDEAESSKHQAFTRFERPQPNDLWQMDFKGDFKLSTGRRCYPLTIMDDHSRFSLAIDACGNQRGPTVQCQIRKVFRKYGIPLAIYVDNGNPWGTAHRHARHTRFSLWLMRHDIEVIHGKPYHPQGRGKLERFHRTLNLEVIQGRQLTSLKESQSCFDPWRTVYNHTRPHEALQLDVPASRYQASVRSFKETQTAYQYSSRFETRRPNNGGQFKFKGSVYRVSEIYNDQAIGLSPTEQDGIWDVYYCRFQIGTLDQREVKFKRTSRFS